MYLDEDLGTKIHDANILVHGSESKCYEFLHPEVFGRQEQNRIETVLGTVDSLVWENENKALDFGAGTGNLTGKLLRMNYKVTAVDISAEMCSILRHKYKRYMEAGKLFVVNSPVETTNFKRGEFDLVACYSTLHHLPDYLSAIQCLSAFLKKGGIMYLDHEASPSYWVNEARSLARLLKFVYFHSSPALNAFYFQIRGIDVPSCDYALSDYWHKKEHSIDHQKIEKAFEKEKYAFYRRFDYHLRGTWVWNPFFGLYRRICQPEMSLWIAKK